MRQFNLKMNKLLLYNFTDARILRSHCVLSITGIFEYSGFGRAYFSSKPTLSCESAIQSPKVRRFPFIAVG